MSKNAIIRIQPLGFPWQTQDPFLTCVHHRDNYPAGNSEMGPIASLEGRNLGNDFIVKDGWRMYHGLVVPGFPAHPHRGFETVTVVLKGLIDHADSLGSSGRYGNGDVQWLTTGKGVQHSEMFPLLNQQGPNTLELFQIWLNLPADKKMVDPHFKMLWSDMIPKVSIQDEQGRATNILIIAGTLNSTQAPPPPPDSYASNPQSDCAIWNIVMEPDAEWFLPAASSGVNRSLYFYEGMKLEIDGETIRINHGVELHAGREVKITNGPEAGHLLLLQGRPLHEPVAQYGPFVMNTHEQIQEAFVDYQENQFGGWPWPRADQVHERSRGKFADGG